jgi:hypothetical protein
MFFNCLVDKKVERKKIITITIIGQFVDDRRVSAAVQESGNVIPS